MIGVFIDHDFIACPVPTITEGDVSRCDAEVKPAEPETAGATAGKAPNVAGTKTTAKVPVLPRPVEMIGCVAASGIMPHPNITPRCAIDVRDVRMAGLVAEIP